MIGIQRSVWPVSTAHIAFVVGGGLLILAQIAGAGVTGRIIRIEHPREGRVKSLVDPVVVVGGDECEGRVASANRIRQDVP